MSDNLSGRVENWYENVARQYFPYLVEMAKDREEFSADEAARRRDAALRNALSTPPKPHQPTPKKARRPRKHAAASKPKSA